MDIDWPNLIFRGGVIVMGVIFLIRQGYYTIHSWPYMAPAFALRSFAFMALVFSAIWGVTELYFKNVNLGPRNVVLFFAMLLAVIAVLLPDKYQQFPRPDKENKK